MAANNNAPAPAPAADAIRHFYADGFVHPHFSFSGTEMLGNPGMVGDNEEYGSPIALQSGETPESWMLSNVGPADKWR